MNKINIKDMKKATLENKITLKKEEIYNLQNIYYFN